MEFKKNNQIESLSNETASNEHSIRLEKVSAMNKAGKNPWPSYKPVTNTTQEALDNFTTNNNPAERYSLAGRIMTMRDHGKTFFCNLQDRDGQIQIYIKKETIGEATFNNFKAIADTGDIFWVEGTLFTTKRGEITLNVTALELLSKCLHPLPEKYHGLADIEQRYRQRHLDLMTNQESREKFKKRSAIIQSIRSFLTTRDFIEVETPMLHSIPGGAAARPFTTHHNAYNMDLFLRIAPELFLKRLVVGGFERVFEINRNFRNEGISTRHNPEFTMLEFYMAHGDYLTGMCMVEELIANTVKNNFGTTSLTFQGKEICFQAPFKRMTVEESLIEIGGLTAEQIAPNYIDKTIKENALTIPGNPGYGMKLFALFEHLVEAKIIQPTFITGYPLEVSPLAKKDEFNPSLTARAELFIVGMEFANLFTELNDPIDQADRFKQQANAREAGDHEAHYYDADFIRALEYGLPPTVGVGIGIDRLVMLLTNTATIKDVILFPTLKLANTIPNHNQSNDKKALPSQCIASPALLQKFKNPRIAVVVAKNIQNIKSNDFITPAINTLTTEITNTYTNETLGQAPEILTWRDAYRSFGSNPSEFPSSIESLYKRIIRGNSLNSINPLVDIYNYISLKYMLPAGGEDLDTMQGNLELTFAGENETAIAVLGKEKPESPYKGEVIYKDNLGTICRRWNWREAKRTIITPKTTNAIFLLEALDPITDATLTQAHNELIQLIKLYCNTDNTTIQHGIININNHFFNF